MPLAWIYQASRVTNEELAEAHAQFKLEDSLRVRMNREYCAKLGPGHFQEWAKAAQVLNQMEKK